MSNFLFPDALFFTHSHALPPIVSPGGEVSWRPTEDPNQAQSKRATCHKKRREKDRQMKKERERETEEEEREKEVAIARDLSIHPGSRSGHATISRNDPRKRRRRRRFASQSSLSPSEVSATDGTNHVGRLRIDRNTETVYRCAST